MPDDRKAPASAFDKADGFRQWLKHSAVPVRRLRAVLILLEAGFEIEEAIESVEAVARVDGLEEL